MAKQNKGLHSYPFLPRSQVFPVEIEALPNSAEACATLGGQCLRAGRARDALRAFDRAIALQADQVDAHIGRSSAMLLLQRPADALASGERAVALAQTSCAAHCNLGNILEGLGRLEAAEQTYRWAVQYEHQSPEAHFGLGFVLIRQNRLLEAVACMSRVLELQPENAQAWINRGQARMVMQQDELAFADFNQALRINPRLAEPRAQVGLLLRKYKRHQESLQQLRAAWQVNPSMPGLLTDMLRVVTEMCEWSSLGEGMRLLQATLGKGSPGVDPFVVLGMLDEPQLQLHAARIAAASCAGEPCPEIRSASNSIGRKLRVGYYSADFRQHATTVLTAQLFEQHGRDRFEWFAFDFGPLQEDATRERVRKSFDHFINVRGRSDSDVAAFSRELGIDIAVDLKGFTTDHRLGIFSFRCAPVQVSWLGYPGTTGAKFMDYVVADKVVLPPPMQPYFSEKVVYLPHSYQCNDRSRPVLNTMVTREEHGLPEAGFVFCCFNNNYKILPPTFDSWMRILRSVPGSVLWLLEDNPFVGLNLRREAEARGVAPDRLVFAPRMDLDRHLARHTLADLFLDTWPYNAHTTARDALWTGLPLLTCAGRAFASRVAASLLHAVGLPEMVTETPQEYEARAIALASNPEELATLRSKLCAQIKTAPLFDTPRFARDLEAAYISMHARSQAGLPPGAITV